MTRRTRFDRVSEPGFSFPQREIRSANTGAFDSHAHLTRAGLSQINIPKLDLTRRS
jgi:hypothetical protein